MAVAPGYRVLARRLARDLRRITTASGDMRRVYSRAEHTLKRFEQYEATHRRKAAR